MDTITDTPTTTPAVDEERLHQLAERVAGDIAAAAGTAMIELGDRLGLYRAMVGAGPLRAEEVANRAGCVPRLVGEWLYTQAAAGYVEYDAAQDTFKLTTEQAIVLATDDTPAFVGGAAQIVRSLFLDGDRLAEVFQGDGALGWGEHHHSLYLGCQRFLGHTYDQFLVESWIPQVAGLDEALRAGGRAVDVGCGTGVALIALARAYPRARFVGIDLHEPSLDIARRNAAEAGVADRVTFAHGSATSYAADVPFDAVFFFEALHDMGDPDAALRHAVAHLTRDGAIVAVEINAQDDRASQLGEPMARMHFAASTALCTPNALAQEGPRALGNQVGVPRWAAIFAENGLSRVRELDRTPIVLVLEARR